MKFIIELDDPGEFPSEEIADQMEKLVDDSPGFNHRNLRTADPGDRTIGEDPFVLLDVNGNRIGRAYFEDI